MFLYLNTNYHELTINFHELFCLRTQRISTNLFLVIIWYINGNLCFLDLNTNGHELTMNRFVCERKELAWIEKPVKNKGIYTRNAP